LCYESQDGFRDSKLTPEQQEEVKLRWKKMGKFESHWIFLGSATSVLPSIAAQEGWTSLEMRGPLWTDERSNVLGVLKWGGRGDSN
jgi:hypothetical protein